jgi:hypothetical protein
MVLRAGQFSPVVVLRPTGTFAGFSDRWLLTWLRAYPATCPVPDYFFNSTCSHFKPNRYTIHCTVRDKTDSAKLAFLNEMGGDITYFDADLLADRPFDEAAAGCTAGFLHVASPIASATVRLMRWDQARKHHFFSVWTPTPRPSPFRSCLHRASSPTTLRLV